MIDGKTQIYGLIGDPVEHSLSPLIQNSLAEMHGKNMVYLPMRVLEEDLEGAICGAHKLHINGLNVTAPHKEKVMKYLSEIDQTAKEIGAVNTLLWTEDGYKGFNTDIYGLERAFESDGFEVSGKDIILIGAGGAARAVGVLLARLKASHIYILNRTKANANELSRRIIELYPYTEITVLGLDEFRNIPDFMTKKFNVIQASSVGLEKRDEAPILDDEFYNHVAKGYDLIYNPLETLFMRKVKANEGEAYNGMHMLLSQALGSFEIWHNGVGNEE